MDDSQKVFFTLREYKENYQKTLKSFLNEYEDNSEVEFIKEQLHLYRACLKNSVIVRENTMIIKNPDGSLGFTEDTIANLTGEYIVDEVEEKIRYSRKLNDINYEAAERATRSFDRIIEFLSEKISDKKKGYDNLDTKKPYWLLVGVKFADGEIYELNKKGLSATAIADKLGNKNYRPYISTTLGGTSTDDKNIYSSKNKINSIIEYCKNESIPICDEFVKNSSLN